MSSNEGLQSRFAPFWFDDAELLKNISKSAFILRYIYRSTVDSPETRISSISDTAIERMTGMERSTIRRARQELYDVHLLRREGYHKQYVYRYERINCQA